jgi:hypothetical protein
MLRRNINNIGKKAIESDIRENCGGKGVGLCADVLHVDVIG